ncbi:MAG: ARMT1-like domain-containing protein [Spirochaetales bacterium]|jgi:uncharacterized protein with ATP-grasp and redox domains|nr:ARMT1-like domain-containing protein [Spirochaetales bacterium]
MNHAFPNQVVKIADLLNVPQKQRQAMMKESLRYMGNVDFAKSSPEVMGETWKIIRKYTGCDDPYKENKRYYNQKMLELSAGIDSFLREDPDPYTAYLKAAIIGNVIDFASNHAFDIESVKKQIAGSRNTALAIDHSGQLFDKLKTAKTLLYLGDNCGEIVVDKLFIRFIKKTFPGLRVFYGVRGEAIVNDVTEEDARMVGMDEEAQVIGNGDVSLGTVIERASGEFRKVFSAADLVIAKGQGNYEGLWDAAGPVTFFLLMAKCKFIAGCLGVRQMDIACLSACCA